MLVFLFLKAPCSPIPQIVINMWDLFQRPPGPGYLALKLLILKWYRLETVEQRITQLNSFSLNILHHNWDLPPIASVCRTLTKCLVNICWKNWWMNVLFPSLGGIADVFIAKGLPKDWVELGRLCGLWDFLLWAGLITAIGGCYL